MAILRGGRNVTLTIEKSELTPIVDHYGGSRTFERTLSHIADKADFLRLFARYVHFNSIFGSGVANLAGAIAARQDLFRDLQEPATLTADRSVEVASYFFATAVDEFAGKSDRRQYTHRFLAQASLKAAAQFFGYGGSALDRSAPLNKATRMAVREVMQGYGLQQPMEEENLFSAMGFHLGSEILADAEFRILDNCLHSKWRELAEFMERSPRFAGGGYGADSWVHLHARIEADHFELARTGSNRAFVYYAGTHCQADLRTWILNGFSKFTEVQARFMENLMED